MKSDSQKSYNEKISEIDNICNSFDNKQKEIKKILRDSRSETSSFKNIKSNPTPFSRKSNDNKLVYIIINQLKNENFEQKKLNLK